MESGFLDCCCACKMSVAHNFNSLKKLTSRAFAYILDSPPQNPSLVAYSRHALPYKHKYKRPAFLELDEEAQLASADHEIRPVMHPKRPLVMNTGYAEVINAGKTMKTNEDQSCFHSLIITVPVNRREEAWSTEMCQIPCIYFGVFDGHAGTGASIMAYHNLHFHIKEKLTEVSHMLILSDEEMMKRYLATGLITSVDAEKLIVGALESAFESFDEEVKQQRYDFRIDGGCTAMVAIFILGKLYIANAGDCRGVVFKDNKIELFTNDHNPESERRRVQTLALYKPNLLMDEYTRYQFQHRCRKKDIGTRQLYRDHNMSGWGHKLIDKNDIKPQLVCGEGKRARLLDTIGTTRGFGDHDLEVPYAANIKIKPFLLATPDVYVYDLADRTFHEDDVAVIASDGLWEKLSNEKAGDILKSKFALQNLKEQRRYIVAAQGLVDEARGVLGERGWRTPLTNEPGSYDDISVFVIPLKYWKSASDEILKLHRQDVRPRVRMDEYCDIPRSNQGQMNESEQNTGSNRNSQDSVEVTYFAEDQPKVESQIQDAITEQSSTNGFYVAQSVLKKEKDKLEMQSITKSYSDIQSVDIKSLKKNGKDGIETKERDCNEVASEAKENSIEEASEQKKLLGNEG